MRIVRSTTVRALCAFLALAAAPFLEAANHIVKVSGDGQCAQLSSPFTQPLVVRVLDSSGQPVAGKAVSWSDVGGINYLTPSTTTTDATGTATLSFVLGGEVPLGSGYKAYTMTATSDAGAVSFSAIGYPFVSGGFSPAPTMILLKPELSEEGLVLQSGTQTADAVRAGTYTGGGNGASAGLPIPGVGLDVSTPYTNPADGPVASCVGGTALSGDDGIASCTLAVSGAAGTTTLTINVGSLVTFTRTLTLKPAGTALSIVQGNNQSGLPGSTLPITLVAKLSDSSGNAVSGESVTWSVVTAGTLTLSDTVSTSSSSGLVSTRVVLGAAPGTYQVKVATGSSSALFNVTVQSLVAGLTVTTASLPGATLGAGYSQALAAAGGASPYSWALISGSLPAGMTLSSGGIIAGTPSTTGTASFTVKVTDATAASATRSLSIAVGTGLAVATVSLAPGSVGSAYSQTLSATGGTAPYSWAVTSGGLSASILPPGLAVSTSGVVSGTPSMAGSFTFTVQVLDAAAAIAYRQFTVVISNGLVISTASPLPGAATGIAYSQTFTAAGGTAPYTWAVTTGTLPPGFTLASAGILSGTPTTVGSYTFNVRVTDAASATASAAFSLTVTSGLQITTASLATGSAGAAYSQTLAAAGGTAPYVWVVASGNLPTGLTLSPAGVISGTPLTSGSYTVGIKVIDSAALSVTANFTLTVAGGVVITTGTTLGAGTQGIAYTTTLAASGGTAPYSWTLTSGELPAGLALASTGVVSGTPTATASAVFTVKVTDSAGLTATATFSLVISAQGSLARQGVISQLAAGGSWKTTLYVYNPGTASAVARILFYDENGAALTLPMTVTQAGAALSTAASVIERTLQADSGLLIEVDTQTSATQVGWADVRGSATLAGYAIFRQKNGDGSEYEGTAVLDARAPTSVLLPYDNSNGFSTGVALVNLSSSTADVVAILRDDNGAQLGQVPFSMAAGGHTSFSLPDRFAAIAGRRGVVEFQTTQAAGLAALGLRFNPTLSFTSIPVAVRP